MFEIAVTILSRLLLVAIGFWVYRKLSKWKGFEQTIIGRNGKIVRAHSTNQRGYIYLRRSDTRSDSAGFRRNGIKAPWGW